MQFNISIMGAETDEKQTPQNIMFWVSPEDIIRTAAKFWGPLNPFDERTDKVTGQRLTPRDNGWGLLPRQEWRKEAPFFSAPVGFYYHLGNATPRQPSTATVQNLGCCQPFFDVNASHRGWLVIRWRYQDMPPEPGCSERGIIFARDTKGEGRYTTITPPEHWTINEEDGTICPAGTWATAVHPTDPGWPELLYAPKELAPLVTILSLLVRDDTNPLTMLMNAPQPWRGLGKQIARQLEAARDAFQVP